MLSTRMRKYNSTIGQFLLFAGLGVIGTLGQYTVLVVLVQFWAVDPVFASSLGFVVGAAINYILNHRFTFQSKKRHSEALTKFLIVAIIGAGINGFIMYIGVENTRINYMIIQLFATVLVLFWNFIVNKAWTFAHPAANRS